MFEELSNNFFSRLVGDTCKNTFTVGGPDNYVVQYLEKCYEGFYPFLASVLIFSSPRNTRKPKVLGVFRGYKIEILTRNGLMATTNFFMRYCIMVWKNIVPWFFDVDYGANNLNSTEIFSFKNLPLSTIFFLPFLFS